MKRDKRGYYKAYIVVGHNEDGKEKRKYVCSKDLREVEQKLVELKYMYNKGVVLEDNIKMSKLCDFWFSLNQTSNSKATQKRNKGIIENYIKPFLGNYNVKLIKSLHIQAMLNDMMLKGKKDTVRKTKQLVTAILQFAVINDYVLKNVAVGIKTPKFQSNERLPLTTKQRQAIETSNNKYRDFFVFLMYTGLRRGEVAALTWNDIDFKSGTISVSKAVDYSTSNKGEIKSTKNGKSRIIPMLDKTRHILECRANVKRSLYVFHKADFGMLTESSIVRMTENFLSTINFEFTLHQLRHTFCTILYYSGVTAKKAQQLMRS